MAPSKRNVSLIVRYEYGAWVGDPDTMLLQTSKFALASLRWKQHRLNWNFHTMCRNVSIRGRLLFSVIWPKVTYYSPSKRNYDKSATWRMDVWIIVSPARLTLVISVSTANIVSLVRKLWNLVYFVIMIVIVIVVQSFSSMDRTASDAVRSFSTTRSLSVSLCSLSSTLLYSRSTRMRKLSQFSSTVMFVDKLRRRSYRYVLAPFCGWQ